MSFWIDQMPMLMRTPGSVRSGAFAVVFLLGASSVWAQAPAAADKEPLLRLEAGGPTSFVTALAFDPDGTILYAAGYDKVVRVWTLDKDGKFVLGRSAYRVPIGPGTEGAINALAVSPDGTWLAVGGLGVIRGGAGFRNPGIVLPEIGAMDAEMRRDQGRIYVFNTKTRALTVLRGHQGPVLSLAFAPARAGKLPLLASTALEFDQAKNGRVGAVRLWDVSKGEMMALGWDQPNRQTRPGLAIWHTGDGPKQVRIAYAWGDGRLRVWDVASGLLWDTQQDGDNSAQANFNIALAGMGDQAKILTGSFQQGTGSLRGWNIDGNDGPQADNDLRASFPSAGDWRSIPRALELFSARGNGQLDHAAIALRNVSQSAEKYSLRILGLSNLAASTAEVPLWNGGGSLPVLAATANGRYLAVAGNAQHEIRVYAIQDLLNNVARPRQLLHSNGILLPGAAFARRGPGELGLLLSLTPIKNAGESPRAPKADDLVFDFTARRVAPYQAGWNQETLALGDWRAVLQRPQDPRQPTAIAVSQGQRLIGRVVLKPNQMVTDFALRPPRPPVQAPILVVAYHELGQPTLCLYDARSGEQIYQYTGHTDPIRSVCFSADGRSLVTAAEDQTVCVWGVNEYNLGKFLGQRGMLRGVAVKKVGADVVVAKVEADSPADGKLAVGDVIEKVAVKAVTSARDFYETVFVQKPGTQVALQVRGKPNVQLPVSQGIGDRKPLLCLFVTRGEKPRTFEWVGWSPIGPYDSSGANADRNIGWHFNNTDQPEGPSSFAFANEYRKQRREGILKHLVGRGSLPPALKDWEDEDQQKPLSRPKMSGWIDEIGPDPEKRDARGQFLLRRGPATLKVAVDDFPLDKVDKLQWQVVGDAAGLQDFSEELGRERTTNLPQVLARPGVYRIRIILRTLEAQAREYVQELTVRYQSPAPVVQWDPGWLRRIAADPEKFPLLPIVVNDEELAIAAEVKPDRPNQKVAITLQHDELPPQLIPGPVVNSKLKLKAGPNLIRLRARNEPTLAGYEADESTTKTLVVVYRAAKKAAPQIALTELVPVQGGDQVPLQPGQAAVTRAREVRLKGTITAEEPIEEATLDKEKLQGFVASRKVAIDQLLTFKRPGPQVFQVLARTKNSDPTGVSLTIDYEPDLPRVVLTSPPSGLIVYDEGKGPPEIPLETSFIAAADPQPFQLEVLLNDKPLAAAQRFPADAKKWSAKFSPVPGGNRIQLRLSRGPVTETTDAIEVRYERPPKVLEKDGWGVPSHLQPPLTSAKPLMDMTADVYSALPPSAAPAEVNGRELAQVKIEPAGATSWRVSLLQVPLDEGKNEVRLWVTNAEGRCRQPGVLLVNYQAPPRAAVPPEVVILEPLQDVKLSVPRQRLRFRISSASALKRVTLVRQGKVPMRQPYDLSKLAANTQGGFEIEDKIDWELSPGPNTLRVEAVNDGGEQQSSVVANYIYTPVRLEIGGLAPKSNPEQVIRPRLLSNGRMLFGEAPEARCTLDGRVLWDETNDELLKKTSQVRLYVNGKRQRPILLKPAAVNGRERIFHAELQLSRTTENLVEIELPDAAVEAGNRNVFALDCARPEAAQEARLLIVSYEEKDKTELANRAISAMQAERLSKNEFRSPAFKHGWIYGPLTGAGATPDRLFTQLCIIKKQIDALAQAGSANDVVIIYYEGKEAVTDDGHFFETAATRYDPDLQRSAFTCAGLERFLNETMGAQILLLDVARDLATASTLHGQDRDQVAKPPGTARVGVMRYLVATNITQAPQLLSDMKEATSRRSQLADVDTFIADNVTRYKTPPIFDGEIPGPLKPLPFGQTRPKTSAP
jgi:WD40 repeat protein